MNAATALQMAVYTVLSDDEALSALLGPDRIFDHLPTRTFPPYILFGNFSTRDYSAANAPAEEHLFELEFWSDSSGRKQIAQLAETAQSALELTGPLTAPYHLTNLEPIELQTARIIGNNLFRALLRMRAVTETA
jgi:hypothetical protein